MTRHLLRTALLAVALASSGCWTKVCVDHGQDVCAEDVESVFFDAPSSYVEFPGMTCDDVDYGTSCRSKGFRFECGGYWYPEPCD